VSGRRGRARRCRRRVATQIARTHRHRAPHGHATLPGRGALTATAAPPPRVSPCQASQLGVTCATGSYRLAAYSGCGTLTAEILFDQGGVDALTQQWGRRAAVVPANQTPMAVLATVALHPDSHGGAPLPNFAALLDDPSHQLIEISQQVSPLAGCGMLVASSIKYRLTSPRRGRPPRPRPEPEPGLVTTTLPFVLVELDETTHMSLVSPSRYFPSRADAFAAAAGLNHKRFVVADTTVRVDKPRADYEYTDLLIQRMKKDREERNQYDRSAARPGG
jgi:hypothetical protein